MAEAHTCPLTWPLPQDAQRGRLSRLSVPTARPAAWETEKGQERGSQRGRGVPAEAASGITPLSFLSCRLAEPLLPSVARAIHKRVWVTHAHCRNRRKTVL